MNREQYYICHFLAFQAGHEVAHVQGRVRARELRHREETALRQPGESTPPTPAATLSASSDARGAEQAPKPFGGEGGVHAHVHSITLSETGIHPLSHQKLLYSLFHSMELPRKQKELICMNDTLMRPECMSRPRDSFLLLHTR